MGKIKIVALVVDEHKIIKPLEKVNEFVIEFVNPDVFSFNEFESDIILTVSDWRANIASILIEAKKRNIPTLMFQDGTLDWIIQYKGDKYGGSGGPTHFHPILTDKIATIGYQSARLISSWNEASKVEVVGFPIIQSIIDEIDFEKKAKLITKDKVKVLVTSTRQGWFCEEQKLSFVEALLDLNNFFSANKRFEVVWRLSRNLSDIVGVENTLKDKESYELKDIIVDSDIVVSAQSTVVVEAMLQNKPVAIIDYLNSPQFYSTSWFITNKKQIADTIESMLSREANRMSYQDYLLNDILQLEKNSIELSAELIKKMVEFKSQYPTMNFPENMLGFNSPFSNVKRKYELKDIYPKIGELDKFSNEELIFKISRYKRENELLRNELKEKSIFKLVVKAINKIRKK
jgi:hypothetical protein